MVRKKVKKVTKAKKVVKAKKVAKRKKAIVHGDPCVTIVE